MIYTIIETAKLNAGPLRLSADLSPALAHPTNCIRAAAVELVATRGRLITPLSRRPRP